MRTLQELYQVTFRKKLYRETDELQSDLDGWLGDCNMTRAHRGKIFEGRTPYATFVDGARIVGEKILNSN